MMSELVGIERRSFPVYRSVSDISAFVRLAEMARAYKLSKSLWYGISNNL